VLEPPTDSVWFEPAGMVKAAELLSCKVPLIVKLADNVSVVELVMRSDEHAEATSTVGLFVVVPIFTASPATGWPVDGDQLLLVLQFVLVAPVHVYVFAVEV
jgi:hypothetical protein